MASTLFPWIMLNLYLGIFGHSYVLSTNIGPLRSQNPQMDIHMMS